jgi:beta-glucosidase
MGREFKDKGVNVVLGPVIGPLGRIAEGGRNWEGFSNDPYLSGELVRETVSGLQESVIACVKHFILNEQETNRNPPLTGPPSLNVSVSSNLDDKTIHELYLWPFQDAIYAGAGSIMCSYNQINGSYGCQNSKTLNGLLKEALGFQGFVVTDWGAQHSGLASARAGLDMVMPSSAYWMDGNLTLMVTNGSLPQTRLDDMLTRILASWHRYAQIEDPGFGMPISLLAPHELVDVRDVSANDMLLQAAIEGHVLVKNVNGALPLQKPKLLSLFGYDGPAQAQNEPPLGGFAKWTFGLANTQVLGPYEGDFNDTYLFEVFLSSEPWYSPVPGIALNGTLYTGGGSGSTTPAYIDAPYDAFLRQARTDGTLLAWDFYNLEPTVNAASDACIVFINAEASEGWDRPSLADSYSDHLVENVASQCSNTIVAIHNAGIRLVDRWIDNPNVTAVIYAHLPGQDSGQALVDVMYGMQSPSGRLPYTVANKASDYGKLLAPVVPDSTTQWHTQANFTEGVYIDYKHFIAKNITPRFEFGYGLTYSTFEYSNLQATVVGDVSTAPLSSNTELIEGGVPELWQIVAQVTTTVTNTGSVAASEVAQLYVHVPGGPAKVLRGFEKTYMEPGESCSVQFQLTRRDLSTWDVVSQNWLLQSGAHDIYVGKSVLDIQLQGSISIP